MPVPSDPNVIGVCAFCGEEIVWDPWHDCPNPPQHRSKEQVEAYMREHVVEEKIRAYQTRAKAPASRESVSTSVANTESERVDSADRFAKLEID